MFRLGGEALPRRKYRYSASKPLCYLFKGHAAHRVRPAKPGSARSTLYRDIQARDHARVLRVRFRTDSVMTPINRMSGNDFGHRVGEDVEIVRGTLCQILRDHLGNVELLFGDTIRGITQTEGGTQVQFTKNGA